MDKLSNVIKVIKITDQLKETYLNFCEFLLKHSRNPSVREIAELNNITSTAAFHRLRGLVKLGLLDQHGDRYIVSNINIILPETYNALKDSAWEKEI